MPRPRIGFALSLSLLLAGPAALVAQAPAELMGITSGGDLYRIDRATGGVSLVGNTGLTTNSLTANAARTGLVTARLVSGQIEFWDIDPATAAASMRVSVPVPFRQFSGVTITDPDRAVVAVGALPGCVACPPYLAAVDLAAGTLGIQAMAHISARTIGYDPEQRLIILMQADAGQMRFHDARTLAPGGGGPLLGRAPSNAHTVEWFAFRRYFATADRLYTVDPGLNEIYPAGPAFPAGLTFEAIAWVGGAAASVTTRAGTPPNPPALLPSVAGMPRFGEIWDPQIDHTNFVPNALTDALVLGFGPANIPTPFGTVLCQLAGAVDLQAIPGRSFLIQIPWDASLSGVQLCAQGVSIDGAGGAALTNALDVVIGHY